MPLIRADYPARAVLERAAQDIDVNAIHQGYLKALRRAGGTLITDARVVALQANRSGWVVEVGERHCQAGVVVNAAGAWADQVGQLAGAMTIGLVPKRRTALIVAAPAQMDCSGLPAVADVGEEFYIKPESGRLLISPADETASDPCDAQPDEFDVATCVDRVERAFHLNVTRIENKWAGLRSFVADKCPVIGYDPHVPDFFWLAGQGGYGIQSCPGVARYAAASVLRLPPPQDILDHALEPQQVAPQRLLRT